MNWQQKKELTEALLQCPCINHPGGREAVIHELPYRDRIRRSHANWEDVINIINTAAFYPGGVLYLIDIVRGFEGEASLPLAKVEEVVMRIFREAESGDEVGLDISGELPKGPQPDPTGTGILPKDFLLKQQYRIIEVLTRNEGAAQYAAYDVQRDKSVLIKADALKDQTENNRFVEQAVRLCTLAHPDLPKVYDYTIDERQTKYRFLVMDWVEGKTLAELLHQRGGRLSQREALIYTLQICQAVHYLHQQQPPYLHLDITPKNIKLHQGQARFASLNTGDPLPFTPGYTPIEQEGDMTNASTASDIYALGATLHTLLTGQAPPVSEQRVIEDTYLPPHKIYKEINPSVSEAVRHALQLYKSNRPESVASWAKTLQDFLYAETETYLSLCSQLEDFLAAGQWQEADDETANLMLTIAKKQNLRVADIENFPCVALQVIDSLWERYSDGHFGFRKQEQICRNIIGETTNLSNKEFREFSKHIGWCTHRGQLKYNNFSFKFDAEEGHLPTLRNTVNNNATWFAAWRGNIKAVLARTRNCLSN